MAKFKVMATQLHDGSYKGYSISRAGQDEETRIERIFVDVFDTYENARAFMEACMDRFGHADAKKETAPHLDK